MKPSDISRGGGWASHPRTPTGRKRNVKRTRKPLTPEQRKRKNELARQRYMSNLEAARKRGRESYAKYQKPKRQCDEAMRVREALERKARRDKKKAN